MSTKKTQFEKDFATAANGQNVEALAAQSRGKAKNTIEAQIAMMKANEYDNEEKVEEAKEALKLARVNNGQKISDGPGYISNLLNAQKALKQAQRKQEQDKEVLEFLEEQLGILDI